MYLPFKASLTDPIVTTTIKIFAKQKINKANIVTTESFAFKANMDKPWDKVAIPKVYAQ